MLVIALMEVCRAIKRFSVRIFANHTSHRMRRLLYNALLHRQFGDDTGSLMTKAISDVDSCVEGMRKFTTEIFETGVVMIAYLAMLLYYDVRLTILACMFTPLSYVIAYVGHIFTPLESIGMEIQSIQDAAAGISRIQDFLNEADSKPDIYKGEGDYITFDHVTFGYLPDQPILKDYSFKVAKGEHVTFVGRTGKGKSTIFKLLLGLYQPQKGKILLDGHSPDDHTKNQRHFLAICEQGVALVDGRVKDQITLYDNTITAEMIDKALAMVGLTDIVKNLQQGLNTPVSDINLSQG